MSDRVLGERLEQAAREFDGLARLLAGSAGKLAGNSAQRFERIAAGQAELRNALGLLAYRRACWDALLAVRDGSDEALDISVIGGQQMPFDHARYLTTQAYLAATWSLSDLVTRAAGRVLCTKGPQEHQMRSLNLWQHFLKDGESAPWMTVNVLQECYGWPIALSYVIRNHFTHEGGVSDGWVFFEGPTVRSGFTISEQAWAHIYKKATKDYKMNSVQTRCGGIDPSARRRLDEILAECHREMDEALGILVRSASSLAGAYAAFLHE